MALNKRQREQLRALCGELHEDDGVDPREYFKPHRKQNKERHKARQLCRQVERTLALVLSGETGDSLLNSLTIVSVTPSADSSRLLVTVSADLPADQFDRPAIEARLAAVQGRLRSEVSAAITRKKTPVLTFEVVGPDGGLARPEQEARQ